MVRTGVKSDPRAPVSFESLGALSLPRARSYIAAYDEIDAVRVSLGTAVAFITDLDQREEAAFPHSQDRSTVDVVE